MWLPRRQGRRSETGHKSDTEMGRHPTPRGGRRPAGRPLCFQRLRCIMSNFPISRRLVASRATRRTPPHKPWRRYRPRPDVLEERRVLTPFLWTGAVNNNWTNPGNWVMLRPPTTIPRIRARPKTTPTSTPRTPPARSSRPNVNLNANITVGNVQISPTYPGTITLSTGNTAHILTVTRQYQQYGGTIAGPGTLFLGAAGGAATSDIISGPAKIAGGNALVDVRSGSTLGSRGPRWAPTNSSHSTTPSSRLRPAGASPSAGIPRYRPTR